MRNGGTRKMPKVNNDVSMETDASFRSDKMDRTSEDYQERLTT